MYIIGPTGCELRVPV